MEEGMASASDKTKLEKHPMTLRKMTRNLRRASITASEMEYFACNSKMNPVSHIKDRTEISFVVC